VCAAVQHCEPADALRVSQRETEPEESAVIVGDEVEAVEPEGVGDVPDPIDLGVVSGRGIRRIRPAEPRPVGGDDTVYDPERALRDARDVFWRNGYAATSLDDLAAGMGMNRPSIYAAFGDKRALYLRTAADYAEASRSLLARALAGPGSLRDILYSTYRGARDFYLTDAGRGCFLIGTAVTEANRDTDVQTIVDSTFDAFTALFTERFEKAVRDGELAAHPPEMLAQIATAALNNLAVRVRAGATPELLETLIEATVTVICACEPPRTRVRRRAPRT
jgi:AcrR family transcriptional regulator